MAEKRYYYKTQDGKGTWNLKTPLTETEKEEYGAVEITVQEWTALQPKPHVPTAAEKVAQEKKARIAELKGKLRETDYCVIKIAEGAATVEEYAEVIAQRQSWRTEINQLESEL